MHIVRSILITACVFFATQASAENVFVHFLCDTAEKAKEAAYAMDSEDFSASMLPGSCVWIKGERQATVISQTTYLTLPSGDIAVVGEVVMLNGRRGFSAGKTEALVG